MDSESEDLQLHVPDARTEVRTLGNKAHGMLREYGLGRRPILDYPSGSSSDK